MFRGSLNSAVVRSCLGPRRVDFDICQWWWSFAQDNLRMWVPKEMCRKAGSSHKWSQEALQPCYFSPLTKHANFTFNVAPKGAKLKYEPGPTSRGWFLEREFLQDNKNPAPPLLSLFLTPSHPRKSDIHVQLRPKHLSSNSFHARKSWWLFHWREFFSVLRNLCLCLTGPRETSTRFAVEFFFLLQSNSSLLFWK